MIDTRDAFEAFLRTPSPDSYDASNADALHIWQAATLAERERIASAMQRFAADLREAMAESKTLGEKYSAVTLGKIKFLTDVAAAISQGGKA